MSQAEKENKMVWHEKIRIIDQYFPFLLLIYGAFLLIVLEIPFFQRVADAHPSKYFQNLQQRKGLAWVCLVLGALWSLQNLWLYK